MRDEDDPFRHYVPLLRRVIIFVAVLAAIPVVLWTITVLVRSYVATPRAPTYRSAALTTPTQSADGAARPDATGRPSAAAASQPAPSDAVSAIVEARATTMDAREAPAAKGPGPADRMADSGPNAQPDTPRTGAVSPASSADAKPPDVWTRGSLVNGTAPAPTARAAQQPAPETDWPSEAAAAAPPLAGPVPLPRRRPTLFAMAQHGIPMPRPRPGGAAAAEPEAPSSGPVEWLRNLIH